MRADLLKKFDEKPRVTCDQSISSRIVEHRTYSFFTWACVTACKYLNIKEIQDAFIDLAHEYFIFIY
jgi:hypothetical protein